jgi:predicted MFS family arabinose efflux permease
MAATAFGMVVGQVFHDGAVQAMVPELAGREGQALDRANGRVYAADTAGKQLVGPPAGSAAYAVVPWVPFAADAVSFLASAVLLWRLPRHARTPHTERPPLFHAIWAGTVWLARHLKLRLLAVIAAAANLAYNCAWATFVLFATDERGLDLAPAAFGLLMSAYAVGGVVGGLLARRFNAVVGPAQGVVVLTIGHALAWPLIAVTGNGWAAAPLLAMVGAAQTMTTVTNVGLRQRLAPATMLNRVTAAFRTLVNSASPVGALLGGLVASVYGLAAPLYVAGAVLLLITLTAGWPLVSQTSTES